MSRPDTATAPVDAGDNPTGWTIIARNQSVVDMIDTLLDLPPHREFNKSEFADLAGVSRKSVHSHIGLLQELDVIEPVPDSSPERYRFTPESDVSKAIMQLDGAVNAAGPHTD